MLSRGTHVSKKEGMRFVGRVLSRYQAPGPSGKEEWWIVVLLDKNEASDHLQHLYPERLFEAI